MDDLPTQLTINGINARSPKFTYDLTLKPEEIRDIFLNGKTIQPTGDHKKLLADIDAEVQVAKEGGAFDIEFGRDANSLKDAGWGLIFPAETELPLEAIKEALNPLIQFRQEAAGDLFHIYSGADGYQPNEATHAFMSRHKSSRGTVYPRPDNLPYYLLLVGNPQEIPFYFQYELDATYLVGRIYFGNDPDRYYQYARSVVAAEKTGLNLARRAVFFGTAHEGDGATQASSSMLVKPLSTDLDGKLNAQKNNWQVEYLQPTDCKRSKLESLFGRGDPALAPAFLFTATHGMVFPSGDKEQLGLQGALLCQDLQSTSDALERGDYLGAEDITDDFNVHGMIAFHFACFGGGTPAFDNFSKPGQSPARIAQDDFIAALPQRLLSHPRGGALAVVGHIDRAWTYSFKWKDAGQQTQTFTDTLVRLFSGFRLGNALDQFNQRYAQLSTTLSNWYDQSQVRKPTVAELLSDWTANNDARGYALFGDPAASLAVAPAGGQTNARVTLPIEVFKAKTNSGGSFSAEATVKVEASAAPDVAATNPAAMAQPDLTGVTAGTAQAANDLLKTVTGDSIKTPSPSGNGFPYIINNAQGGTINIYPPGARRALTTPEIATGEADFGSSIYGTQTNAPTGIVSSGQPGTAIQSNDVANLRSKLADFMDTLGQKLNELTSLEVKTYVSSDLSQVKPVDGKLDGPDLQPRAMTVMRLNGNTEIVVPTNENGGIDNDLWQIHRQTFDQAQAWRESLVKAIADLVTGFIPGK